MDKFTALLDLFKQGSAVSDPALWKMRQVGVNVLAGVIMSIVYAAKSFDYDLSVTSEDAASIAGGVLVIVNTILTITTSKTIGTPA